MQTGVLVVAPRSADIASGWFSATVNVGIAGAPWSGRSSSAVSASATALVGGLLASAALGV